MRKARLSQRWYLLRTEVQICLPVWVRIVFLCLTHLAVRTSVVSHRLPSSPQHPPQPSINQCINFHMSARG